jgi:CAAX protease family protein
MSSQTPSPPSWFARHQLGLYFVLAFALSWSIWPLMLLNPDSSPLVPFGPGLAAVIVAALAGGRRGLLTLLVQLGRWRVNPIWYAVAVLGPFLVMLLAAAVTIALGAPAPSFAAYADVPTLLVTLLSTMVIVGLFEELGWRGYALPTLQRTHSALWSAVVLGAVWAAWHLPELVSDPTGQRPPLPFTVAILAQSVLFAWVYNSTRGALPIVIVFHAAINTAGRYLLPEFTGAHYSRMWWATAGIYLLAAAAVTAYAGTRRLTTQVTEGSEPQAARGSA